MVYPQSPVLEIGTNFTATCVITNTLEVTSDDLIWNLSKTTVPREQYKRINNTALSVTISVQGEEYEWLYCIAKKESDFVFTNKGKLTNGIRLEKGYRPEKPDNLSCVALHKGQNVIDDLITCKWNSVGRQTKGVRTSYNLTVDVQGTLMHSDSTEQNFVQVPLKLFPNHMTLDIWVDGHNALGTVTSDLLSDNANCFVKVKPPKNVTVISEDVLPFSLLLNWDLPIGREYVRLKPQIRFCEKGSHVWIYVPHEDTDTDRQSFRLQNLRPDTEYIIQVSCRFAGKCHRALWSDWSSNTTKRTPEAKPEGKPDLWRIIAEGDSSGEQQVQIICKDPVAANGRITNFNLRLTSLEEKLKNTSLNWEHFPVNGGEADLIDHKRKITHLKTLYVADKKIVKVELTANNSVGGSAVATLVVTGRNHDLESVDSLKVTSDGGQIFLNWKRPESRRLSGYVVEWAGSDRLDWQRESKNITHTVIRGPLEPFVCYNISVYPIYGFRTGRPVMVQAYLEQGVPQEGSAVELKGQPGRNEAHLVWTEIPPEKRRGFITNYTVIYSTESGSEIHNITVPGNVTSYTLKSLVGNTKYNVKIRASNVKGSVDGINYSFTTLKYAPREIEITVVAVTLSFLFFVLLIMLLCFYKREEITKNFWPQIPDPGMSTIRGWTPEYPSKSETPRETCLSGFSVVDVEVCDVKSVLDEDKSSLPLKKDKYLSEEHSSGIGGSSCMSSPRQSVSDSDEGGDMADTTASTVQYSSVVASNGYKGQTPGSQAQQVLFSRSESTQPLLDCEDNADILSQDGIRQSQRVIHESGHQDESNLDLLVPHQLLEPLDFCPLQKDLEMTTAGGDQSAETSSYMPQKGGYRPHL
ncbi:interleukin-6 receptor subunit beta isoform 2-T3 [Synchiropus picturatus]